VEREEVLRAGGEYRRRDFHSRREKKGHTFAIVLMGGKSSSPLSQQGKDQEGTPRRLRQRGGDNTYPGRKAPLLVGKKPRLVAPRTKETDLRKESLVAEGGGNLAAIRSRKAFALGVPPTIRTS